ncbi:unnamed protein product, partial [Protopolystoma xenopodis]
MSQEDGVKRGSGRGGEQSVREVFQQQTGQRKESQTDGDQSEGAEASGDRTTGRIAEVGIAAVHVHAKRRVKVLFAATHAMLGGGDVSAVLVGYDRLGRGIWEMGILQRANHRSDEQLLRQIGPADGIQARVGAVQRTIYILLFHVTRGNMWKLHTALPHAGLKSSSAGRNYGTIESSPIGLGENS